MANRRYTSQFLYSFEAMQVLLSCNFVVDSTNGNGLGIRNLKGSGFQNVFMNTSATPQQGNPNPAAGIIMVQIDDNYNRYLGGFSGFVETVSGTNLTSVTAGTAYVIVSLGTTTLAQWKAVGLPVGVTPAVGVAFIATATAAIGGTGIVQTPKNSGILELEVMGDPNTTLALQNSSQNGGGIILFHTFSTTGAVFSAQTTSGSTTISNVTNMSGLKAGQAISGVGIPLGASISSVNVAASSFVINLAATASASGVAMVASPAKLPAAPANGSVVSLNFLLSNSSVSVNGQ